MQLGVQLQKSYLGRAFGKIIDVLMSRHVQFKIFRKELYLPSPFAKSGDLFWPDYPQIPLFCSSGGCDWKDWSK